jgi:hypothetical protein
LPFSILAEGLIFFTSFKKEFSSQFIIN